MPHCFLSSGAFFFIRVPIMKSMYKKLNQIHLPYFNGEESMIEFNLETLEGLPEQFKSIAKAMLQDVGQLVGMAFFTIHGKTLGCNEYQRRPAPHTDGNYCKVQKGWGQGGGNGWKIGENGPAIDTKFHDDHYNTPNGGIILASSVSACNGWEGEFDGLPGVGGDCRHIELNEPTKLDANRVYYGNNHFIHESLPMPEFVHRVFARITLPIDHEYQG